MAKKILTRTQKKLGLYVHIPFCASKCQYCDFCSSAGAESLMPKYQQALVRQQRENAPLASSYLIDSIYFGGGTPSYYGAARLLRLLDGFKHRYNVLLGAEITLEANPDSLRRTDLRKLVREGFNRVSIGIQSANDRELKNIGRRHNFDRAETAVKMAQDMGFTSISADIMYGLPGQTTDSWADTIARVTALKPTHISAYGLKLEPGTPLYIRREISVIPDDDTQAKMYLYAVDALERMGYRQYEISNFAVPGFESVHNMKYWQLGEYMGFGAAAASDLGGLRYSYLPDIQGYIDAVSGGGEIIAESERLASYERASEYVMLGMRTNHGISEEEYRAIYQVSFERVNAKFEEYMSRGLARRIGDRLSLTPQGFLISNILIGEIIELLANEKLSTASPWLKA